MGDAPILHVVKQWLPVSETFVADALQHSRHRAVVISSEPIVNRDRFPRSPLFSLAVLRSGPLATVQRQMITLALLAAAWRFRPSLVHVHFGYHLSEVQGLVRRTRLPLVVSLHGHDVTSADWGAGGHLATALKATDAIVVPSRFLASAAEAAGAPPERIRLLPSGVDLKTFTPSPLAETGDVVFVGRFVEKKGLDVLLEAWPGVAHEVPEVRLRLLGYGPLEAKARAAGERVEVVVAPDREAVRGAIRGARVVVTPSRTAHDGDAESLLLVNLEAQASGRPVVTTNHGGIPEFVRDGETALVVPENDAQALARAIIRILTDQPLAARLGAAGPSWAANFDVRVTTARVDALYDELLGHRHG